MELPTVLMRSSNAGSTRLRPRTPPPSRATLVKADSRPPFPVVIRHESPSPTQSQIDSMTIAQHTSTSELRPDSQSESPERSGNANRRKSTGCKIESMIPERLNPSLTLENSGSVARDHLASERTFLAYVRTSLTISSTGVALVQLFTISAETSNKGLEKYSRPIGATIIIIGLLMLALGVVRYFTIQSALVRGRYPVARASAFAVAVGLSAIIIVVFGILLGVRH